MDTLPNPYASPESDDEVVTSAETATNYALAGRGMRLAGSLIDGLLMAILFMPLYLWLTSVFYPKFMSPQAVIRPGMSTEEVQQAVAANTPSLAFNLFMAVLGFGLFLLVHGYLLATNGQTVGKRVLGIKIVRTDGRPASFGRLVGRRYLPVQIVAQIPIIGPLIVGFVDPLLIFRRSRKCLHDDIADTIVVEV